MKILLVEDDLATQMIMKKYLSDHGECHPVKSGQEALDAFNKALDENAPFDLISLDIMMPEMDGHEVLKRIRSIEKDRGIGGQKGVKVVMTTALSDGKNVVGAFKEQCEAYIVKPADKAKIEETIRSLGLI